MNDLPSGEFFDAKTYQRPQQNWVCGHHALGQPCPIGPSGRGQCQVQNICQPWHDGTTWNCTRARAWGGKCQAGPVPDPHHPDQKAICPHLPVLCQPVRSLRSKRRRLGGLTAAAALGCCHSTASQSPLDLLGCAFGDQGDIADSHKCLECHHEFGEHALLPHNTNPQQLAQETSRLTAATRSSHNPWHSLVRMLSAHSTTETGELACATCHHEHHGANFDLAAMTNSQCQSCHVSAFSSFTDGHPEFAPRSRAFLYFDHVTHLGTHFPAHPTNGEQASQAMTCSDCHIQDVSGTSMILDRFENICARCHAGQIADDQMPTELRMPGNVFLTLNLSEIQGHLPNDPDVGNSAEHDHPQSATGNWPVATIDRQTFANRYEALPPFMEALLLADDEARAALGTLRAALRADPGSPVQDLSGDRTVYASAIKRLIHDLVTQREQAVTERLCVALGEPQAGQAGQTGRRQAAIVATQLADSGFFAALAGAQNQWFPERPDQRDADADDAANDSGESDRLVVNDAAQRTAPSHTGPWTISEDGLTLVYRSRGHADPLLRALLDFAAASATQYPEPPSLDESGVFDRLFRRLAAPEATGRCMKCHTIDAMPNGSRRVNWNSRQVLPTKSDFTKFSHGPHVTLLSSEQEARAMGSSSDHRCETCHAVRSEEPMLRTTEFLLDDWMPNPNATSHATLGLNSVLRSSCIKCHTPRLAGDNCLQCHNYHVDSDKVAER